MIGAGSTLPMYPGYALGGIISKVDFELPLYEKKCAETQEEIIRLVEEKEKEIDSDKHKALDEEIRQTIISTYAAKILSAKLRLEKICEKINQLVAQDTWDIQYALPLEHS